MFEMQTLIMWAASGCFRTLGTHVPPTGLMPRARVLSPILRGGRKNNKKRKSPKKEDADARKGRKVAKHCAFPMICGSGGSKSRLAKAAGAKPAGQMRESCTPLWREAHFQVKSVKNCGVRSTFGRSDVVLCGRRKGCAPCQKRAKREGFVACQKTMAGVGHLKRICKDEFPWQAQYKRHVHQSC